MNFRSTPERLLTWLDVERVFKQNTALWTDLPPGVHAVRCYGDGAEIEHSAVLPEVQTWLKHIFGRAWQAEEGGIRLRIGATLYPVTFMHVTAERAQPAKLMPYPLWREVSYLRDLTDVPLSDANPDLSGMPKPWSEGPHLVSFHSFKGGVGRTTALMTYALARLQMDLRLGMALRVLVVDADLEAPGVSLWLDDANRPEVSYLQFLEAMHYPPESVENSLDYFAQALRKTSLSVGGSPQRELFVLPAALSLSDIQDMPVQPGHLARNPSNPWILTDHLHALGRRLGVDVVLIDLRAGLSEFSSSVLFDPRVDHFFVTTVAKQAVEGTATVLERLHAVNSRLPVAQRNEAKPSLVLSLLNDDLRKLPDYTYAVERLNTAYPAAEDQSMGMEWLEADFSPSLMSISALSQALEVLKTSLRLFKHAQDWARTLDATDAETVVSSPEKTTGNTSRDKARRLEEVCQRMQFAETSQATDMLVTEPLRKFGRHFETELPNLVSVGAKGAGKTFTFLQLCRAGSWHAFLTKVEAQAAGVPDGVVFPALWSGQFEPTTKNQIVERQKTSLRRSGFKAEPVRESVIRRLIAGARKIPPVHWDQFWDSLIAQHFSLGEGQGLEALNQQLIDHERSVVLVFDGVEEAFPDPTHEVARAAIESLLMLPDRLLELPSRRIGAVVFVRADYVQATLQQNVAQFLARHAAFHLQWSPESFLRLAYWLARSAEIMEQEIPADLLGQDSLLAKLSVLWGRKMGSDQSKEALSARWVFASLCDLKGQVQARDLVRFLRFASGLEKDRSGSSTWQDRVLAPESMRKAIPKCSEDKVDEAVREIEPLKSWRETLQEYPEREMPFAARDVGLADKPHLLAALQELGVIYEDPDVPSGEPRLYLPEIYRAGLGFKPSTAGRARTLSLLKSNAGLPF